VFDFDSLGSIEKNRFTTEPCLLIFACESCGSSPDFHINPIVAGSYREARARWFPCALSQGYASIAGVRETLHLYSRYAQR